MLGSSLSKGRSDPTISEGKIDPGSPLYRFLQELPGLSARQGSLSLQRLSPKTCVFLCKPDSGPPSLVCKFFAVRPGLPAGEACSLMRYELMCLKRLRLEGFNGPPTQVVRPLGSHAEMGCVLVEEFVMGEDLDHAIAAAVHRGDDQCLVSRLHLAAAFFAELHERHQVRRRIPSYRYCQEFRRMVTALSRAEEIPESDLDRLSPLVRRWEAGAEKWDAESTLLHGDATPTNFLFPEEDVIVGIDLERMRLGDPMLDLGFLTADLKHHFAFRAHCAQGAEPFIHDFLEFYRRRRGLAKADFTSCLDRHRFFMALGELRIARDPSLHPGHRRWLVAEAARCLS